MKSPTLVIVALLEGVAEVDCVLVLDHLAPICCLTLTTACPALKQNLSSRYAQEKDIQRSLVESRTQEIVSFAVLTYETTEIHP